MSILVMKNSPRQFLMDFLQIPHLTDRCSIQGRAMSAAVPSCEAKGLAGRETCGGSWEMNKDE